MSTNINLVAAAIDSFVRAFRSADVAATDVQVRPSGDDVDMIKVWVDLGGAAVDVAAWAKACEVAIKSDVPGASDYQVAVRAE